MGGRWVVGRLWVVIGHIETHIWLIPRPKRGFTDLCRGEAGNLPTVQWWLDILDCTIALNINVMNE